MDEIILGAFRNIDSISEEDLIQTAVQLATLPDNEKEQATLALQCLQLLLTYEKLSAVADRMRLLQIIAKDPTTAKETLALCEDKKLTLTPKEVVFLRHKAGISLN